MKRLLQWLAVLLVGALLVVGGWIALNWEVVRAIPQLPSSYEAKEFCSCRFVSRRDEAFCARFVKQSTIPMQGRRVDEATKSVTATALWTSNTARYRGPRAGCVLER